MLLSRSVCLFSSKYEVHDCIVTIGRLALILGHLETITN